jgi:transcriptional regulator of aromatic amino acid metabolism
MRSADFAWLSDETLLKWLTARDKRPNLMVLAHETPVETVAERLARLCAQPVTASQLPGRLRLPDDRQGTILLQNVSSMSVSQQIALNDWIDAGRGVPQVISITTTNLWELVLNGDFLEGLFYRLNVMCLNATPHSATTSNGRNFQGLPRV